VPFEFIQPFDVFFRREDRHVIAFFSGHPVYEAVEAFLGRRHGRAPLVRAILTRHDQSQVDYINDRATVAERFPVGTSVRGTVRRLEQFGAFVELAPGLDGLVHVSRLTLERRVAARLRQLPALVEDVEATIVVRGGADPEVRRDAEGPVPALTEVFRKRRETPVEVGMAPIDAVPRRIRPGKN